MFYLNFIMKNNYLVAFLLIFVLVGLLSACTSSSEDLLFDRMDVDVLVNPIVQNITTGNEIRAWTYSDTEIIGFGGAYAFYTPNKFDSLYAVAENSSLPDIILYNSFEQIVSRQNLDNSVALRFSEDYGVTYDAFLQLNEYEYDGGLLLGLHNYGPMAFLGKDLGWIASYYTANVGQANFPTGIKIYRAVLNGAIGQSETTLLAELSADYTPVDILFFNTFAGWLLVKNTGGSYVYRTSDGGTTWQGPFAISNNTSKIDKLNSLDLLNIYAYSQQSALMYYSKDAGQTWFKSDMQMAELTHSGISDMYAVNEQVAYCVANVEADNVATISDIYKTGDGGANWQKVNNRDMYGFYIDFWDENIGLTTSNNVLEYTTDGGQTWDVLVYPIP